jgi:hypothetical protein
MKSNCTFVYNGPYNFLVLIFKGSSFLKKILPPSHHVGSELLRERLDLKSIQKSLNYKMEKLLRTFLDSSLTTMQNAPEPDLFWTVLELVSEFRYGFRI